jgi:signal transduction histidine kinase/CheY-like chemotaxis protein
MLLATLSFVAAFAVTLRRQRRTIAELNDSLTRAREEADQQKKHLVLRSDLDTVKDEFISTVSHELRTPLTSIRGALGLLSAGLLGNVDAKALNLLRIASTNTERLIRLINDILDLERMDSGRAPLVLRRCSLLQLAGEAVDTMTALADAGNVRLDLACVAPRDAIYFDGDPDRILQVLTNLLSNAIKFSPPTSTVSIQIDASPDALILKVADRGRGIPADKLESVFDRFQQVESSDAQKKGGTGLGLAICRSIVQQHGGAIWAMANDGVPGTTLWVQFSRSSRSSDPTAAIPVPKSLQRGEGLILICDDDPSIRTVVAEQLRLYGYDILEAESGEQTIAMAADHAAKRSRPSRREGDGEEIEPISAILLDLQMPGMSGWETLHLLKETPATAAIPVVILSVVAPAERPTPHPEAQGWIQKPFNENLLLAELGRVLHRASGPASVLLVEDDQDLAGVIIAGFIQASVAIDHASTRQQAMDRCLLGAPGLIILDLTLPDGDGFSLVEWLRQREELRALPLVVYSGRELDDDERSQLRLGPTEFLTKATVQPKEVEDLVLSMVQRLPGTAKVSR